MIQVEICTPSRRSAEAAKAGGAERIELCRNLACGGLTPSDEDIDYCVRTLGLRTHVLVRPRAGNFYYDRAEMAEIMDTVERCGRLGAAAVVVGFLDYEGRIDTGLTREVVAAAGKMEVTFHRAFDEARQEPMEALEAIAMCGCTRLLTSGQKATALEGADVIGRMVGATPVKILAGSGVTPGNVAELIARTGVGEVHGSCKAVAADGTVETDAALVRQMIERTRNRK